MVHRIMEILCGYFLIFSYTNYSTQDRDTPHVFSDLSHILRLTGSVSSKGEKMRREEEEEEEEEVVGGVGGGN